MRLSRVHRIYAALSSSSASQHACLTASWHEQAHWRGGAVRCRTGLAAARCRAKLSQAMSKPGRTLMEKTEAALRTLVQAQMPGQVRSICSLAGR